MSLKASLFALTCLFASVEMRVNNFGERNFTSEWMLSSRNSFFPPMVTKIQSSLIFITFPPNNSIKLESSRIIGKPCELPLPQIKKHRAKNILPMYAEAMGNDNLLVAILESKFKKGSNHTIAWLFAIDPLKCSYDAVNFTIDASMIVARDAITIVPYRDTFDVFVKSDVYCVPGAICNFRYGNDLTLLNDYENLLVPYEDEGWDLITKRDFDPSDGYLYIVMNAKLNNTMLRYYDSKFSLTQEIRLNYDDSVSYWYDDGGSASMCFRLSDQVIECMLLDARMEVELEVNLYYESFLQYYSIIRLPTGEALVLTILASDPVGSEPATFVQLIDRSGQVTPPMKFQEFACDNIFEMNSFKLRDGLFCISIICPTVINTKCIAPESELEF